jgi:Na+/H+ antiporter NhaD/arsenite permease-like protein
MIHTGILQDCCQFIFKKSFSVNSVFLTFILFVGIASAIFTKDTMAVIVTPIALVLAKQTKAPSNLFLMGLCFAVAIGSMFTPIGNPQNILVVSHSHMQEPFKRFMYWLGVPTAINLVICYAWLRLCFKKHFTKERIEIKFCEVDRHNDRAWPVYFALILFACLIIYDAFAQLHANLYHLPIGTLALIACVPIYIFCKGRRRVLRKIDWHTLVLFASLFIVMAAVWHSGFFQHFIKTTTLNLQSPVTVLTLSTIISQFIANVPLVELYLPFIQNSHIIALICLAAGSTIASNIFIISAASNIIAVQIAEKSGVHTLTFWRFAGVGIPLAIVNLFVYYGWIALLSH